MDERRARDWWRQTSAGRRAKYIQAVLAAGFVIVLSGVHNVLADLAPALVFFFYAGRCARLSRQWAVEGDLPDDDGGSGEPTAQ
jgi:hypothetical protein